MKFYRFREILSSWHWESLVKMPAAERSRRNKANGFWTVEGFLSSLSAIFFKYYWGDQCVCIDEQMPSSMQMLKSQQAREMAFQSLLSQ
jgi:hypothetical protein